MKWFSSMLACVKEIKERNLRQNIILKRPVSSAYIRPRKNRRH